MARIGKNDGGAQLAFFLPFFHSVFEVKIHPIDFREESTVSCCFKTSFYYADYKQYLPYDKYEILSHFIRKCNSL